MIDPVMKLAGGPAPIDMVLFCPACGLQHIDAPSGRHDHVHKDSGSVMDTTWDWSNPPHRSHLCHGCGHQWRPADVPTNGVATVKTRGQNDSPIVQPRRAARFDKSAMGRLLLEASTGMHGDLAKQLCDAWCEMASQSEDLRDLVGKLLPHAETYVSKELSDGAYGMADELALLERARKVAS